jgi:hypothetical protein
MPRPRRRVVRMDEVKIEREGDYVHFNYTDPEMGGTSFKLEPEMLKMSDRELLDYHNQHIRDLAAFAHRNKQDMPAVEIVGRPQIEYSEQCGQWVPRGGVVRCRITSEDASTPAFEIDDQTLTLEEFGRMLSTYEGWGMRIIFVPEDELHNTPQIELQ